MSVLNENFLPEISLNITNFDMCSKNEPNPNANEPLSQTSQNPLK
jgi:hypothetical protein